MPNLLWVQIDSADTSINCVCSPSVVATSGLDCSVVSSFQLSRESGTAVSMRQWHSSALVDLVLVICVLGACSQVRKNLDQRSS
jgi:hypothetical protein